MVNIVTISPIWTTLSLRDDVIASRFLHQPIKADIPKAVPESVNPQWQWEVTQKIRQEKEALFLPVPFPRTPVDMSRAQTLSSLLYLPPMLIWKDINTPQNANVLRCNLLWCQYTYLMRSGDCLLTACHDSLQEIISGAIYQGVPCRQTGEANKHHQNERFSISEEEV